MENEVNTAQGLEIKPELVEHDKLMGGDERTAMFLCEVANSNHSSITVKYDIPSKKSGWKDPFT